MSKNKKPPYQERSDIDKIKSNWNKVCGLFEKREWSSVIIRAVTASEIAANLAIRAELQNKRNLESKFVDSLLIWANGIQGKFERLLLPVTKGTKFHVTLKSIQKKVTEINRERNSVAHSGEFRKKQLLERLLKRPKKLLKLL